MFIHVTGTIVLTTACMGTIVGQLKTMAYQSSMEIEESSTMINKSSLKLFITP